MIQLSCLWFNRRTLQTLLRLKLSKRTVLKCFYIREQLLENISSPSGKIAIIIQLFV